MKSLQQAIETPGETPANESVQAHRNRMKHKTYNWRPVIGSLLKTLQDHNFTLVSVDDEGEEHTLEGTPREHRQLAKRIIDSVDVSHLFVLHPSYPRHLWLFIVLGNEPHETVSNNTDWPILNLALEQFENKWIDRKVPTK